MSGQAGRFETAATSAFLEPGRRDSNRTPLDWVDRSITHAEEPPLPEPLYRVESVVSTMFDQNAYVLWRPGSNDALVVDPGFEVPGLLALLGRLGLRPSAILNTHGHIDHIAGNSAMKSAFPRAPLLIGRNDARMLGDADLNLSAPFGMPLTSPPADRLIDDGERLELAGFALEAREIPGHSPGSIVLVSEGADPAFALVGDVIFSGSVGRTDFPGGSFDQLSTGIRSKLFPLDDAVVLYPGHGPATTIGKEKRTNPFVRERPDR